MAKLDFSQELAKNSSGFLTSEAGEAAIKNYFKKIFELSRSGEKFPIDLDDVWPLCYDTKGNAVRDLKSKFYQDIDYHHFIKNTKKQSGGRPMEHYRISVSCMEFLVARKVRSVFDVYRRVFHRTVNDIMNEASVDEITKSKMIVLEGVARMLNMNDASKVAMIKKAFPELAPAMPDYVKAKDATLSATELLKRNGIKMNANTFNKRMEEAGYLEQLERPSSSSKSGKKRFWKVTDTGLAFGENFSYPDNPRETQPRWFVDKFHELIDELSLRDLS